MTNRVAQCNNEGEPRSPGPEGRGLKGRGHLGGSKIWPRSLSRRASAPGDHDLQPSLRGGIFLLMLILAPHPRRPQLLLGLLLALD
ncbi:MAG TPA: hypothetical protein VEC37_04765 [Bacillota bacterium]|nr:hypothetical protein [Bacillota bacterium]